MSKLDETEYINARTRWVLSTRVFDRSFALEVKYNAVEDIQKFVEYDMGDQIELLDTDAYNARVRGMMDNEPEDFPNSDAAEAWLGEHRIHEARPSELEVLADLVAEWTAFKFLFNPTYNLF